MKHFPIDLTERWPKKFVFSNKFNCNIILLPFFTDNLAFINGNDLKFQFSLWVIAWIQWELILHLLLTSLSHKCLSPLRVNSDNRFGPEFECSLFVGINGQDDSEILAWIFSDLEGLNSCITWINNQFIWYFSVQHRSHIFPDEQAVMKRLRDIVNLKLVVNYDFANFDFKHS